MLAAQFGWAPGFIWLLAGCVPGRRRARHDHALGLDAARRPLARRDRALGDRHRSPAPPAIVAILFILVIALAGLGIAVVNALAESAWGTFTVGATIPIAIFMGFYMFVWRKGHIKEATVIGVTPDVPRRHLRQERRRVGARATSSC